jgi:anti-sigma factor RsiW
MTQSEFIDDYFSGSLTPADKEVFEKRLQTEPAFADEVALYLS